jgi:hypothetical protein
VIIAQAVFSGLFYFLTKEENMEPVTDRIRYKTKWKIRRYPDQEHFERGEPTPVPDINGPIGAMLPAESVIDGNVLLITGVTALWNIITGVAANNPWNSGNASIGVGDNSTAALNNQTGLLAPTNKAWNSMAANYPSVSTVTASWQTAFAANNANFGWQEFVICSTANGNGINLNRVANNQGTKTAGQVWTVSVQVALA